MSLLAESLVEEWLNRDGFFTVRGARFGVSEMDLLAVRQGGGGLEARHIEVQVSTNAVSYITPLTKERARELGKPRATAWSRPQDVLAESVAAWVEKKYKSPAKARARERAWLGLSWSYEFVHGEVRHPEELLLIQEHGIRLIPFHAVLASVCDGDAKAYRGGAGTDIAEMIGYYVRSRGPTV